MKAAKNSGTLVVFLTAIFFLHDAIDVVDAGINVVAHSVRDTRISKSFADKMAQQDVILAPTLVREEAELAFAGEDNPYFENALFRECAGTRLDQLCRLRTGGDRTRDELSRKAGLALVNFETLSTAGVTVCLSTDSGFKMKIGGFSQHRQLELMCGAGLSASASLKAALGNNRCVDSIGPAKYRERADPDKYFSQADESTTFIAGRLPSECWYRSFRETIRDGKLVERWATVTPLAEVSEMSQRW